MGDSLKYLTETQEAEERQLSYEQKLDNAKNILSYPPEKIAEILMNLQHSIGIAYMHGVGNKQYWLHMDQLRDTIRDLIQTNIVMDTVTVSFES